MGRNKLSPTKIKDQKYRKVSIHLFNLVRYVSLREREVF